MLIILDEKGQPGIGRVSLYFNLKAPNTFVLV
jgi:hypothetical protein